MPFGKTEKVAVLAIATSLLLVFLKVFLANISGSVALVADAWHSLADVLISVLVFIGAWITRKQWRLAAMIQNIIALMISFVILTGAIFLVVKSLSAAEPKPIENLPIVLIGAVICAAISRLIGMYEIKVGTQENAPSMIADGRHSIMDVYTTSVVIVGLMGHVIGLRLDTIAALIVVLFILKLGLEVAFMAITGLLKKETFGDREQNPFSKALTAINKSVKKFTGKELNISADGFARWIKKRKKQFTITAFVIITTVYFFSGIYKVGPAQTAIVTIFGKANTETVGPGLHHVFPYPIGKAHILDTTFVQRVEIGFRTSSPYSAEENKVSRTTYEWHSLHLSDKYTKMIDEAIILSGDENLVDTNSVVKYVVSDPKTYFFKFENQTELIRALAEDTIRSIVAVTTIDVLLSGTRRKIEQQTMTLLQAQADQINLGITIISVELQDVHPPVEVVRAFRDVASAKEEKALLINEAMTDRNERIPAAKARAIKMVLEAEGYKITKIDHAGGEGERFIGLATEYAKARDVTSYRLYIQAMEKALAKRRKFIISPTLEPGALDLRIFTKERKISSKSTTKEGK